MGAGGGGARPGMPATTSSGTRRSPSPVDLAPQLSKAGTAAHERENAADEIKDGDPSEMPSSTVKLTLREEIFEFFENPDHSCSAKWYSISMMLLIIAATVTFVLESEAVSETGILYGMGVLGFLEKFELISVVIFTVEYLVRLACCPCGRYGPLSFVLAPSNIIDLIACLPYWIQQALGGGSGLGFMRIIRLVRVFRVVKAGKYSSGLAMFSGALRASVETLAILLFTISLAVIILSSLMYLVEGEVGNPNSTSYDPGLLEAAGVSGETQLFCYGTIPRTFWWAVVTMTTVGYGDCFPVTLVGKIVCMLTALAGVLILALPITVVGSNFQKMVDIHQDDSLQYAFTDLDDDGTIDENELRAFLDLKRREGVLRKDVALSPKLLLNKFDTDRTGTLSFSEFQELKDFAIDPTTLDLPSNVRILMNRADKSDEQVRAVRERLARIDAMLATLLGSQTAATVTAGALIKSSPSMPRTDAETPSPAPHGTAQLLGATHKAVSSPPL